MLTPIDAPPAFVPQAEAQSTTPVSFTVGPEVLVFNTDSVLHLEPAPPALGGGESVTLHGHLWLSEQHLVFSGDKSFQIDYPSIALHAVSRAVPRELGEHDACLYCQMDDHAEDDDSEVHEIWIAVADAERA